MWHFFSGAVLLFVQARAAASNATTRMGRMFVGVFLVSRAKIQRVWTMTNVEPEWTNAVGMPTASTCQDRIHVLARQGILVTGRIVPMSTNAPCTSTYATNLHCAKTLKEATSALAGQVSLEMARIVLISMSVMTYPSVARTPHEHVLTMTVATFAPAREATLAMLWTAPTLMSVVRWVIFSRFYVPLSDNSFSFSRSQEFAWTWSTLTTSQLFKAGTIHLTQTSTGFLGMALHQGISGGPRVIIHMAQMMVYQS